MEDTIKLLRFTKKVLERGWNRYDFARTTAGHSCSPFAPEARSYCMSGALRAAEAYLYSPIGAFSDAWELISFVVGGGSLTFWNDCKAKDQAEAVAAVAEALKVAKILAST